MSDFCGTPAEAAAAAAAAAAVAAATTAAPSILCTPATPCASGGGDCDTNADCQGALECVPSSDGLLTGGGMNDYCGTAAEAAAATTAAPTVLCSPTTPCASGGGDCDTNADCQGALVCVPSSDGLLSGGGMNDFCGTSANAAAAAAASGNCTPETPCVSGGGDCDSNAECQGALACVPSSDGFLTGGDGGADFCGTAAAAAAAAAAVTTVPPAAASSTLCTPTTPCTSGGGDCDSNADCMGTLVCIPSSDGLLSGGGMNDFCGTSADATASVGKGKKGQTTEGKAKKAKSAKGKTAKSPTMAGLVQERATQHHELQSYGVEVFVVVAMVAALAVVAAVMAFKREKATKERTQAAGNIGAGISLLSAHTLRTDYSFTLPEMPFKVDALDYLSPRRRNVPVTPDRDGTA